MKAAALGLSLGAAALGLRADSLDDHWALRGVLGELREPAGTLPLLGPNGRVLAQLPLAQRDWDTAGLLSLRQYGGWDAGLGLRLEWNLLAQCQDSSAGLPPQAQPLGRSPVLERRIGGLDRAQADLEVDQLNLRWQGRAWNLVAGRQPVNLGQNFYFSPLDLFQPFQAQDSYRDFRAGVDALRATLSTGEFTQVEALAVAGYQPGPEGGNATQGALWLDGPQGQGSYLLRVQSGGDAWAFSALGGRFAGQGVGGGSLQLEGLGSSWTLEGLYGHGLDSVPGSSQDQGQATLGWARQWNAWLNSRVELSRQVTAWAGPLASSQTAQTLAAVTAQIQVSPLWTLGPALLCYGDAGQAVALLDVGWSASENGDLHLILSLPVVVSDPGAPGQAPSPVQRQPGALSLDYRWTL